MWNLRLGLNNKGMTLLELLVGGTIAAAAVGVAGSVMVDATRASTRQAASLNVDAQLTRGVGDILKVGRIAQECQRVVVTGTAPGEWLQCRVDMNKPPTEATNDDAIFRFGLANGRLEWQQQNGARFDSYIVYDSIAGFEICDDALMGSAIASACPIPQSAIGHAHSTNRNVASGATPANRFFRFRLIGRTFDETGKGRSLQSAFSIRHPLPNNLMYQWGQWE